MAANLRLLLVTRAEEILDKLQVPRPSKAEASQIRDPLNAKGEYTCLLTFNDSLATRLGANVHIQECDLKLLSELHLIVASLSGIEGAGELRYTEALANLYSQPNNLDKRTMFWEASQLVVHYDGMWTKSEGQCQKAATKKKNLVVRTCTLRTSLCFLRCALWTKPAEAKLVAAKLGPEAAAVHMKAFVAREGTDMGSQTNAAWARAYVNRRIVMACKLQLHDLRHVWIAITKKVTRSLAEKQCEQMMATYFEAGARLSNHSLETEEGTYAGQSNIVGVEGPDREVYKQISNAFNRRVFGDEVGYEQEV